MDAPSVEYMDEPSTKSQELPAAEVVDKQACGDGVCSSFKMGDEPDSGGNCPSPLVRAERPALGSEDSTPPASGVAVLDAESPPECVSAPGQIPQPSLWEATVLDLAPASMPLAVTGSGSSQSAFACDSPPDADHSEIKEDAGKQPLDWLWT